MIDKLKPGDKIAVYSETFLSKGIRWFMQRQYPDLTPFSHIATAIDVWGEIWISEALAYSVRTRPLDQTDYVKSKKWIIIRRKEKITDAQIKALGKKAINLTGLRYQWENLPQWILQIIFKIDTFRPRAEKAIYCSEEGAILENVMFPGTWKEPNQVTPMDHVHVAIEDYTLLQGKGRYTIINDFNINLKR